MARDMAEAFNRTYGDVFVLPEPLIDDSVATITGLDGRKMSKSYGNVIPIFAPPDEQRKLVKRIVTDSRPPEEPKDPDTDNLFQIYAQVAPPDRVQAMRDRYLAGGVGYGEVKEELADVLRDDFAQPRDRYDRLMHDRARIDEILAAGAERARKVAANVLGRARTAVGLSA
jgi:tryptophanyl-tRNA synthetase